MIAEEKEAYEIEILETLPDPVFIVGMNGSGTTMLADSLGKHPEIYVFRGETRLLPYLIAKVEKFGDLNIDKNFMALWDSVRKIPNLRWANGGITPPLPRNWREFPRNVVSVVDAVFRFIAAKEGKVRWGEKTPQHVQHLKTLHEVFPTAKFLHIIRDGRDCAASLKRRFRRNPERSIYRWKKVVTEGKLQGSMLGDCYMEVKYEEVTLDPEYWMRNICSFVGVQFDERVLKSSQPFKAGKVRNGGILPNSGKWRNDFTDFEIRQLEKIAGACLKEQGYPAGPEYGDKNPQKLKLVTWMVGDYWREFTWFFIKRLRKKQWNVFGLMYHIVVRAIKQKSANKY
jgi:hypothetical protein